MKTQTKEKSIQSTNEAILWSAAQCAKMCGISRRSWFRLNASARVPACVRVGASPRWVRKTLEQWIAMGCPDRRTFEAMKEGENVS
ncbi:MAG: helix-turn-helix transcriptional regulator [Planctomycetota bacterium]